jgi:putative endonuclease
MERAPCVYMLASGFNGTLYVGVTSNLAGRVFKHRGGITRGFVDRYDVRRLVWFEMHHDMVGPSLGRRHSRSGGGSGRSR